MLKVIEFAKELRNQGLSYSKIVEELESKGIRVSRATVMRWCKGSHNPFNRMNLVELSPSPELSYIVGVFFGDGSIYLDNAGGGYKYKVRLKVVDKEFAEEFKRCLESIGLKPSLRFERNKTRTDRWCVEAYSKSLYTFLKQPKEKLFEIAREYPREFLRGFFDSEGSVGWDRKRKKLSVKACNYDLELLQFVQELLASLGIHSKIYVQAREGRRVKIRDKYYSYKQDFYCIDIYRREAVAEFAKIVGFTISRKAEKLKSCLESLGYL
jgi:intein-encoded DNA endonuclease-like protein